jgi:hypothetical protein
MSEKEDVAICPLLSESGSEPSSCQKKLCAWYIPIGRGYCSITIIALFLMSKEGDNDERI